MSNLNGYIIITNKITLKGNEVCINADKGGVSGNAWGVKVVWKRARGGKSWPVASDEKINLMATTCLIKGKRCESMVTIRRIIRLVMTQIENMSGQ